MVHSWVLNFVRTSSAARASSSSVYVLSTVEYRLRKCRMKAAITSSRGRPVCAAQRVDALRGADAVPLSLSFSRPMRSTSVMTCPSMS